MNDIQKAIQNLDLTRFVEVIGYRASICECAIHNHELLQQVDGFLLNGKFIRVMKDSYGYRMFTAWRIPKREPICPKAITAIELKARIILESMER